MAVARYGAIGESSDQRNVVSPSRVRCHSSRPLPIAVRPSGTVISKSYVALSCGLSLAGYQPGEPCGSLTTNAPSSVGTKPSLLPSGSMTGAGEPSYSTCTTKREPSRRPRCGVTVSSCPERLNAASRRSTVSSVMS